MSRIVHLLKAGKLSYLESLKLQKLISNRLIQNNWKVKNVLILTEHDPVYTIGIFN